MFTLRDGLLIGSPCTCQEIRAVCESQVISSHLDAPRAFETVKDRRHWRGRCFDGLMRGGLGCSPFVASPNVSEWEGAGQRGLEFVC